MGLTAIAVLLIVAHGLDLPFAGFRRLPSLGEGLIDHVGFAVGILGLAICALAQRTMGQSWRVGIDEVRRTDLVTRGIFRYVRNPTYLGLNLVNVGFWLIWPTAAVAIFVLTFSIVMEIQVRCEEVHLLCLHGEAFRAYRNRTWRYLPWIY